MVEPQSSKLKVLGSISSGGFHTAVGTRRCSAGRVFNSTWVTIQLIDVRTLRMQTVEGKTRQEQKKAEAWDRTRDLQTFSLTLSQPSFRGRCAHTVDQRPGYTIEPAAAGHVTIECVRT